MSPLSWHILIKVMNDKEVWRCSLVKVCQIKIIDHISCTTRTVKVAVPIEKSCVVLGFGDIFQPPAFLLIKTLLYFRSQFSLSLSLSLSLSCAVFFLFFLRVLSPDSLFLTCINIWCIVMDPCFVAISQFLVTAN